MVLVKSILKELFWKKMETQCQKQTEMGEWPRALECEKVRIQLMVSVKE
jgi:hypothetical protein